MNGFWFPWLLWCFIFYSLSTKCSVPMGTSVLLIVARIKILSRFNASITASHGSLTVSPYWINIKVLNNYFPSKLYQRFIIIIGPLCALNYNRFIISFEEYLSLNFLSEDLIKSFKIFFFIRLHYQFSVKKVLRLNYDLCQFVCFIWSEDKFSFCKMFFIGSAWNNFLFWILG